MSWIYQVIRAIRRRKQRSQPGKMQRWLLTVNTSEKKTRLEWFSPLTQQENCQRESQKYANVIECWMQRTWSERDSEQELVAGVCMNFHGFQWAEQKDILIAQTSARVDDSRRRSVGTNVLVVLCSCFQFLYRSKKAPQMIRHSFFFPFADPCEKSVFVQSLSAPGTFCIATHC